MAVERGAACLRLDVPGDLLHARAPRVQQAQHPGRGQAAAGGGESLGPIGGELQSCNNIGDVHQVVLDQRADADFAVAPEARQSHADVVAQGLYRSA